MTTKPYKPRAASAAILKAAMGHIQSVPYKVGLRWVFYRLLQDGILASKKDYDTLKDRASTARKRFYDEWRPDTLTDGGRSISESRAPVDAAEMLGLLPHYVDLIPDLYEGQDAVPFLVFESATSEGQFEALAPWADRASLRGDASIPHKWDIAKRCDALARKYGMPVHILYFGDLDDKGLTIPESAMDDIRDWASPGTEVRFTRCGVNRDQAAQYSLPEKPDKPGTWEWEALPTDVAETLVSEALAKCVDTRAIQARLQAAEADSEALAAKVATALAEVLV